MAGNERLLRIALKSIRIMKVRLVAFGIAKEILKAPGVGRRLEHRRHDFLTQKFTPLVSSLRDSIWIKVRRDAIG